MSKRYERQVPGRPVQVDVVRGQAVAVHTAIGDATCVCAQDLGQAQASAIEVINHLVELCSFRIRTIRIDNGHGLIIMFHWHVEDSGMRHIYLRPKSRTTVARSNARM